MKGGLVVATENKSNGDGTKNGENPDGDNPEYENFQDLLKQVLSVPKESVDKRRREGQQQGRVG